MPGKYYEDLVIGATIRHSLRRTITEMDNVLFCALTMNSQPLHLDELFAAATPFGKRIVNGIFTLGLAVGLTVPELTEGTIIANLEYALVEHPHPVFHGDTLSVVTRILDKRPSRSHPDRGIARFQHTGFNQDEVAVIRFERTVLVRQRPAEPGADEPQ